MGDPPGSEESSRDRKLEGRAMDFRGPPDTNAELVALYFEDLTKANVKCQQVVLRVMFANEAALQTAAKCPEHKVSDGCTLTAIQSPEDHPKYEGAIGSMAADHGSALQATKGVSSQSHSSSTGAALPSGDATSLARQPTTNERPLSPLALNNECDAGSAVDLPAFVQQDGPDGTAGHGATLMLSLDVDCQAHLRQHCLRDLQARLSDLQCTINPLGPTELLLEWQVPKVSDVEANIVIQRISQFAHQFVTTVVAIPKNAMNETIKDFLAEPGSAELSCTSVGPSPLGALYKMTGTKECLSRALHWMPSLVPVSHVSLAAVTASATWGQAPRAERQRSTDRDSTAHNSAATEPNTTSGAEAALPSDISTAMSIAGVPERTQSIPADSWAVRLFRRHFEDDFKRSIVEKVGTSGASQVNIAYDVNGFVLHGCPSSLQAAKDMLCAFATSCTADERWLEMDQASCTALQQQIPTVEAQTRTLIITEAVDTHGRGGSSRQGVLEAAPAELALTGNQEMHANATRGMSRSEGTAESRIDLRTSRQPRLQLKLTKGSVAQQQADVLVNSVDPRLNLRQGAISSSILGVAGQGLQQEIWRRYPGGIGEYSLAVTGGHGLSCKHVFHVACGYYQELESEKKFAKVIYECLEKAEEMKMTSIVFPAIGTGILKYPPRTVIEIMHNAVASFSAKYPGSHLQAVECVVFDQPTFETFKSFKPSSSQAALQDDVARTKDAEKQHPVPGSASPAEGGSIMLGRLRLQIATGCLASERSEVIIHATDKYLGLYDRASILLEKQMGPEMLAEIREARSKVATKSRLLTFKNTLGSGSKLVLLSASDVYNADAWLPLIKAALRHADQTGSKSVSVSTLKEDDWSVKNLVPKLLEALGAYASENPSGSFDLVRIIADTERTRRTACDCLKKYMESQSGGIVKTVTGFIGQVLNWGSAPKEPDPVKGLPPMVLCVRIIVFGLSTTDACAAYDNLIGSGQSGSMRWLEKPRDRQKHSHSGGASTIEDYRLPLSKHHGKDDELRQHQQLPQQERLRAEKQPLSKLEPAEEEKQRELMQRGPDRQLKEKGERQAEQWQGRQQQPREPEKQQQEEEQTELWLHQRTGGWEKQRQADEQQSKLQQQEQPREQKKEQQNQPWRPEEQQRLQQLRMQEEQQRLRQRPRVQEEHQLWQREEQQQLRVQEEQQLQVQEEQQRLQQLLRVQEEQQRKQQRVQEEQLWMQEEQQRLQQRVQEEQLQVQEEQQRKQQLWMQEEQQRKQQLWVQEEQQRLQLRVQEEQQQLLRKQEEQQQHQLQEREEQQVREREEQQQLQQLLELGKKQKQDEQLRKWEQEEQQLRQQQSGCEERLLSLKGHCQELESGSESQRMFAYTNSTSVAPYVATAHDELPLLSNDAQLLHLTKSRPKPPSYQSHSKRSSALVVADDVGGAAGIDKAGPLAAKLQPSHGLHNAVDLQSGQIPNLLGASFSVYTERRPRSESGKGGDSLQGAKDTDCQSQHDSPF